MRDSRQVRRSAFRRRRRLVTLQEERVMNRLMYFSLRVSELTVFLSRQSGRYLSISEGQQLVYICGHEPSKTLGSLLTLYACSLFHVFNPKEHK